MHKGESKLTVVVAEVRRVENLVGLRWNVASRGLLHAAHCAPVIQILNVVGKRMVGFHWFCMQVEYFGIFWHAIARLAYELPFGMVDVLVVFRVVEQVIAHFHVTGGPIWYVAVISSVLGCVA